MEQLAAWWDRSPPTRSATCAASTAARRSRRPARGRGPGGAGTSAARRRPTWPSGASASTSFRSPKAFALVVEPCCARATTGRRWACCISWLGQAEQVPLEDGVVLVPQPGPALDAVADRRAATRRAGPRRVCRHASGAGATWCAVLRLLEANAEDYWQVPGAGDGGIEEDEEDEDRRPVRRRLRGRDLPDSTDDDEGGRRRRRAAPATSTWRRRPSGWRSGCASCPRWPGCGRWRARWLAWRAADAASRWSTALAGRRPRPKPRRRLLTLLDALHAHPLPEPSGDYDRWSSTTAGGCIKEQLLYATISTCLDMTLAVGALRGALGDGERRSRRRRRLAGRRPSGWSGRCSPATPTRRGRALPRFVEHFRAEPLLFTPLSEAADGGEPRAASCAPALAQTVLRGLLANLPRLGLLRETYDLLRHGPGMEQAQPTRGRGVTEFNHFFQAAYQAVVETVVDSVDGLAGGARRRRARSSSCWSG